MNILLSKLELPTFFLLDSNKVANGKVHCSYKQAYRNNLCREIKCSKGCH